MYKWAQVHLHNHEIWHYRYLSTPNPISSFFRNASPSASIANESHSVGWKFLIFHQFLLGLFCYSDIYRFESGRCRSLPFFNIFYYFPFPGFPFILIKSSKCAKSDCGCCISLFDFSLVLKFEHKFLSQYLDRREIVMLNKSVHILYHLLNTPVVIKYRILSEKTP